MLSFVIIGLMCNSLGCYWATIENALAIDQESCYATAAKIKGHSVMYFDAACLVVDRKSDVK